MFIGHTHTHTQTASSEFTLYEVLEKAKPQRQSVTRTVGTWAEEMIDVNVCLVVASVSAKAC